MPKEQAMKRYAMVGLIFLLFLSPLISLVPISGADEEGTPDVYVGVAIGYGGSAEETALLDKVSTYTNLLVIQRLCGTTTNESVRVAAERGMYVLPMTPYYDYIVPRTLENQYRESNFTDAQSVYGNYLIGEYFMDEPGGKQLECPSKAYLSTIGGGSYLDMANQYESSLLDNSASTHVVGKYPSSASYDPNSPKFTTDYVLPWFDYKAGYDVVLTEFIYNNSRQMQIALGRGAAAMQNKDWGVMISWSYDGAPYLEDGPSLYHDMVLAYENGAKYIVVFDSDAKTPAASTLIDDHFQALRDFWEYMKAYPRHPYSISERTAYVMPAGYGFGFRSANDWVWGRQDESSALYYDSVDKLLAQYGPKLDVVYNDSSTQNKLSAYQSEIKSWEYTPYPPVTPTATPTPTSTSPPQLNWYMQTQNLIAVVAVVVAIAIVATAISVLRWRNRGRIADPPPPPPS